MTPDEINTIKVRLDDLEEEAAQVPILLKILAQIARIQLKAAGLSEVQAARLRRKMWEALEYVEYDPEEVLATLEEI